MEVSALPNPSGVSGLRGPSALLRLQSDERLIALTRRGQHAAFEVLCSRYQSRLLSFCRHMLGSREDAEDVLQEVFAAAFNAVLADDRAINVRPWLYRIARNRSLNHLRRNTAIGVDSMDVHFAEHGLSTGEKVMRRESFRELIADVQDLPETQRTALLLREIDAMSYDQISLAMDTTVPSVKSLLVRARISLAEAAEARKMSCVEVRLELGETAEGLVKLSQPARRHVRGCERCLGFKRQLRENNRALAAIMPVAPLLILKKLILAKLGTTASAGGAHAGAAAGATASAAGAAGAAAGGGGLTGGLVTAGAGAVATKAAAGIAAAALATAGAVAADRAVVPTHRHHAHAAAAIVPAPVAPAEELVVARSQPQPLSAGTVTAKKAVLAAHRAAAQKPALAVAPATAPATGATAAVLPAPPAPEAPAPTKAETKTDPAPQQPPTQVTQVTSETTQLPSSATGTEAGAPTAGPGADVTTTPTTSDTTAPPAVTTEAAPPAEPLAPAAPPPGKLHRHPRSGGTEAPPAITPVEHALRPAARRAVAG